MRSPRVWAEGRDPHGKPDSSGKRFLRPGVGRSFVERKISQVCLIAVGIEESFKLKRTLLFLILGVAGAVLTALPAEGQVNPEAAPGPAQAAPYKYEVYLGAAYSRLRQVPVSYSGLLGGKVTLSRDWGKYFQLSASGDYYRVGTGHAGLPNPGNPSIYTFLVAPGLHATLYGNLSGVFFGEVGAEHTGGESETPSLSFAGGFGGGVAYSMSRNLAVQLTADRVAASFSLPNNTPQLSYSTHRTWNARATIGVAYRF
jgi:hypothetical protein